MISRATNNNDKELKMCDHWQRNKNSLLQISKLLYNKIEEVGVTSELMTNE